MIRSLFLFKLQYYHVIGHLQNHQAQKIEESCSETTLLHTLRYKKKTVYAIMGSAQSTIQYEGSDDWKSFARR